MTKSAAAKNLANLNQVLNINQQEDVLFFEKEGYHYSVNVVNYGNSIMYQLSMLVNNVLDGETQKVLRKETKATISFANWNNLIVLQALFSLPLSKDKKKDFFDNLVDKITMTLQNANIQNTHICSFCKVEDEVEAKWVVYRGLYLPAHAACLENQYQLQQALIDEENKNIKKLPMSIILSLLGAIIGILPAYIIMFATDYLVALIFALSPVCAFFGYKLGKAPLRWYATVIVVIECILVGALSVLAYYALLLAAVGLPFTAIQELGSDVLLSMVQVVIFVLLGIAVAWGYIRKTNQSKVER